MESLHCNTLHYNYCNAGYDGAGPSHYITMHYIAIIAMMVEPLHCITLHYMTNIAMYLIECDGTAITWHKKTLHYNCNAVKSMMVLHYIKTPYITNIVMIWSWSHCIATHYQNYCNAVMMEPIHYNGCGANTLQWWWRRYITPHYIAMIVM